MMSLNSSIVSTLSDQVFAVGVGIVEATPGTAVGDTEATVGPVAGAGTDTPVL